MPRLLFEKKGNAVWISHLDLMRVFQRAFKRAGLPLKHTQGFSPRPSVSIALPLSVGTDSCCELLDFELDTYEISFQEIRSRLNSVLNDGVYVLDAYEQGRKIRDLSLLQCQTVLEYDQGIPQTAVSELNELFHRQTLFVPKKSKNGIQDQDIIPMIKSITVNTAGDNTIVLHSVICCQNPTLNPGQLILAIERELPHLKPDFSRNSRVEIFDNINNVFR